MVVVVVMMMMMMPVGIMIGLSLHLRRKTQVDTVVHVNLSTTIKSDPYAYIYIAIQMEMKSWASAGPGNQVATHIRHMGNEPTDNSRMFSLRTSEQHATPKRGFWGRCLRVACVEQPVATSEAHP